MPVVVNISSLTIVCQCVPVPGQMSESNRWIQWRSESTCTPGSHLRSCKRPLHPGHRGGLQSHQQVSHLLCIITCLPTDVALIILPWKHILFASSPVREKLLDFLYSVKQPDGSFVMHVGGEVDVRWALSPLFQQTLTHLHNSHTSLYCPCSDVTVLKHFSRVTFYFSQQTD